MAYITVGSTDLPGLTEYTVKRADLDSESTGRSETGILTRTRIRAGVYSIQCTFKVSKTQLKTITDAIYPASFSVTFFDPTSSSYQTATMYAGDREAKMVFAKDAADASSRWELSVSFIQY